MVLYSPTTLLQASVQQSSYAVDSVGRTAVIRLPNTTFLAKAEIRMLGVVSWVTGTTAHTGVDNLALVYFSVATSYNDDKLIPSGTGANTMSSADSKRWNVSTSIDATNALWLVIKLELDTRYLGSNVTSSPTEANTIAAIHISDAKITGTGNFVLGSHSYVKSQQRQPN